MLGTSGLDAFEVFGVGGGGELGDLASDCGDLMLGLALFGTAVPCWGFGHLPDSDGDRRIPGRRGAGGNRTPVRQVVTEPATTIPDFSAHSS